ncbi:hypothetical protein BDZ45DRAFT_691303 [Acephala macrosclerotiorum]|nr:hypothetical protein BDZ45DRAFT_691303 [Acephala macrosclerotiorum]
MVTTRSQSAAPSTPTHLSPNDYAKSSSTSVSRASPSPLRPPNPRAFSSNHIGPPPDLFPTLSAHASRIHKAKSNILLLLLLTTLPIGLYLLNPTLLSSVTKYLSNAEWGTAAVASMIVGAVMTTGLYWTDARTIDWYQVVFGRLSALKGRAKMNLSSSMTGDLAKELGVEPTFIVKDRSRRLDR